MVNRGVGFCMFSDSVRGNWTRPTSISFDVYVGEASGKGGTQGGSGRAGVVARPSNQTSGFPFLF